MLMVLIVLLNVDVVCWWLWMFWFEHEICPPIYTDFITKKIVIQHHKYFALFYDPNDIIKNKIITKYHRYCVMYRWCCKMKHKNICKTNRDKDIRNHWWVALLVNDKMKIEYHLHEADRLPQQLAWFQKLYRLNVEKTLLLVITLWIMVNDKTWKW